MRPPFLGGLAALGAPTYASAAPPLGEPDDGPTQIRSAAIRWHVTGVTKQKKKRPSAKPAAFRASTAPQPHRHERS